MNYSIYTAGYRPWEIGPDYQTMISGQQGRKLKEIRNDKAIFVIKHAGSMLHQRTHLYITHALSRFLHLLFFFLFLLPARGKQDGTSDFYNFFYGCAEISLYESAMEGRR